MVPDGDRRDLAQSSRTVDQDQPVTPWNYHVVCEFVLYDNPGYDPWRQPAGWLGRSPADDIGKSPLARQHSFDF
jgi:hypothetical protein